MAAFFFELIQSLVPFSRSPLATPESGKPQLDHSLLDDDSSDDLVSFSSLDLRPSSKARTSSYRQSLKTSDEIAQWVDSVSSEFEARFSDFSLHIPAKTLSPVPYDWSASVAQPQSTDDSIAETSSTSSVSSVENASPELTASPASSYFSFDPYPRSDSDAESVADDEATENDDQVAISDRSAESGHASLDEMDAASLSSSDSPTASSASSSAYAPSNLPSYARTTSDFSSFWSDRYSFFSIYARADPSTHVSTSLHPSAPPSHTTLEIPDSVVLEGDEWLVWQRRMPTRRDYLLKQRCKRIAAQRERRREQRLKTTST
ncbi:hypothetical protein JCM10908_006128 [Rhodotorula pacifica]|uniref:uncharacterized protein n=1 Tax=Rhodotorula pacifica TaxID=1495444 RepID=UPI003175B3EA